MDIVYCWRLHISISANSIFNIDVVLVALRIIPNHNITQTNRNRCRIVTIIGYLLYLVQMYRRFINGHASTRVRTVRQMKETHMDFSDPYLWYDFMRVVIYWPQVTALTMDRIHPDKIAHIEQDDALLKYKGDATKFSAN